MLYTLLEKLGFNQKEILVYLMILQHEKINATDLAQLTKINRTTIYSVVKELIQKGVIVEDLGSPTRYFIARPPEDLEFLITEQEQQLERKKQTIQEAIRELQ